MSGGELAARVFFACKRTGIFKEPEYDDLPPEYWLGWALAYYQWYSNRAFREIFEAAPASTILNFYHPYHEMDITKFCDRMDQYFSRPGENLKKARIGAKLSQNDLSLLSEVPVRTLQQYEQGTKSLLKASYETIFRLSRALGRKPEEFVR